MQNPRSPADLPAAPVPRRRRRHRRSRAVLAVLVAVALLLLAGAVTESYVSRSDRARFPPSGRLIAVDGAVMHLSCSGAGRPTVVLEAGLGESSLTWSSLQRSLSGTSRVCSYDRAGYGWSEDRDRPWTASAAAAELSALLTTAGEAGPYVLVAHSLGSFVAREFAAAHRDLMAGLVLLDPTNEVAVHSAGRPLPAILQRRLLGTLVRLGAVRWAGHRLVPALVDAQPPQDLLARLPMAYISASPFLYQESMGLSEVQYGLMFGLNALLLAAVSGLSARLTGHYPVQRLLGAGLAASLLACLALLALVLGGVPTGWLAVPIAVAVAALGLVFGNGTALALAAVPQAAGSASALLGALQFALAALVSPLVSLGGGTNPLNLAVVMLVSVGIALLSFMIGNSGPHRPPRRS